MKSLYTIQNDVAHHDRAQNVIIYVHPLKIKVCDHLVDSVFTQSQTYFWIVSLSLPAQNDSWWESYREKRLGHPMSAQYEAVAPFIGGFGTSYRERGSRSMCLDGIILSHEL